MPSCWHSVRLVTENIISQMISLATVFKQFYNCLDPGLRVHLRLALWFKSVSSSNPGSNLRSTT